jgi:hypothetical protein
MRINGMSWSQIEEKIYTPRMVDQENIDKLVRMIMLQQITDCDSNNEWIELASNTLSLPLDKTASLLKDISMERVITFDEELGGMMLKQIV